MNSASDEPLEIERKFLIASDAWRAQCTGPGRRIAQGYLCTSAEKSVRVRLSGDDGTLTVKGSRTGITRLEFQYSIPAAHAVRLLELCEMPPIDKTRHIVHHAGMKWEIDIFHGENEGLLVAEVELEREDQPLEIPSWAGAEVSDDPRYYNSSLSRHPFRKW
ncbi:MAG: CYTH domain-containing protein [Verrucomicrobia bacterium]|nr:CYTH domain-containing protein [Verrucomicrobiota bacterium]